MSSVDTAWLRMDRPSNLMQIVGVMVFDGQVDFARLHQVIEDRLLRFRRFTQIAVADDDGAWWVDDPAFLLDAHLRRSLLPAPAGKAELQEFVSELASDPLNPARPRWEFNLVDLADGDSALILRIHHAIADGIALVGVINSITDGVAGSGESATRAQREHRPPPTDDEAAHENELFWHHLFEPISEATQASLRVGSQLLGKSFEILHRPARALDYARIAAAFAQEAGKLALMPDDTRTRFKGRPGPAKRVAWSEPIALADVKAVCAALGCSVNDILLSSAAGALRGYLSRHGEVALDTEIRALVPVNLRPPGEPEHLGNRFGLVALLHPIGIENPLARLHTTRQRMHALKGSCQATLTFSILGLVGMAPKFVQQKILDLLASKATAVMTNVPGPQHARYLAGSRIAQQMFWVPQSGDVGIGVSILTYDGQVQFGLLTDQGMVPDPELIVADFAVEFEKLLWLVLMEPHERLAHPEAVESGLCALVSEPPPAPRRRRRSAGQISASASAPAKATTKAGSARAKTARSQPAAPVATTTRRRQAKRA
jgi:WS/DGAT/MGAT family acyltransferase